MNGSFLVLLISESVIAPGIFARRFRSSCCAGDVDILQAFVAGLGSGSRAAFCEPVVRARLRWENCPGEPIGPD